MKRFGLTGNTGTGKTTVADALRSHGVAIIDADRIAREVVAPGEPALTEIAEAFGAELLDDDGVLRRQALGRIVFADPEALRRLEAITHPRIAQRAATAFSEAEESGASFAVYDSAILVESGLAAAFDGLIVVTAPRDRQLARIVARDGLSEADAAQRIDAQMPEERKVAVADFVVENSGSLESLHSKVVELFRWMAEV